MTDAANIFGLEREAEGKNPLSISVEHTLFFFFSVSFFQTDQLFHCFKIIALQLCKMKTSGFWSVYLRKRYRQIHSKLLTILGLSHDT